MISIFTGESEELIRAEVRGELPDDVVVVRAEVERLFEVVRATYALATERSQVPTEF